MKAYFSRRYMFSASHRLHTEQLSESENRAVYGKCNNPHGHGHNYIVEATVAGEVSAETGMVINMVDLDHAVRTTVLDRFDHKNLNLDAVFLHQVPTTENLTKVVFALLQAALEPAQLARVRIEETENNFFEVSAS